MSRVSPNLGLTIWSEDNDEFNPTELADNWDKIDADFNRTRPANQVEIRNTLPTTGLFNGRLVYLTNAVGGFVANTLVFYNGANWEAFSTPEIVGSLPVSNLFQGRMIVLSSGASGFGANTVLTYTGTTWQRIGGIESFAALPVTNNYAGRVVLLTAAAGGFPSYSLVGYDGSTWQNFEKRGVQVGATLPVSPYAGQIFVLSAATTLFNAWDVVLWNGTKWVKINSSDQTHLTNCNMLDNPPWNFGKIRPMPPNRMGITLLADASTGTNWSLIANPDAAATSTYVWEVTGGNPYFSEVVSDFTINNPNSYIAGSPDAGPAITICREGDYRISIGFQWHSGLTTGGTAYMSYDIGATPAVDADAAVASTSNLVPYNAAHKTTTHSGLLAGTTLTAKYKADTGHISKRWMSIMPIRII